MLMRSRVNQHAHAYLDAALLRVGFVSRVKEGTQKKKSIEAQWKTRDVAIEREMHLPLSHTHTFLSRVVCVSLLDIVKRTKRDAAL